MSMRKVLRTGRADTRPEPRGPDGLVADDPAAATLSNSRADRGANHRRLTVSVMCRLGFEEGCQMFDGDRGFGQPGRDKHRPDVDSMSPGLEGHIDTCGGGDIPDPGGIVVEDFVLADLDEHRRKTVHVGEDRGAPGVAGVSTGKIVGDRGFEHLASH